MNTFPAGKHEWLAAALRVAMILFSMVVAATPLWYWIIAPALARGENLRLRWLIEDMFLERYGIETFFLGISLGVTIILLSFLCRAEYPSLAQFGYLFVGISFFASFVLVPACARAREKPVIYLYPTAEMTVNVQLRYGGTFTHTIPEYPDGGWTVTAKPSGELIDLATGEQYGYLFWEGRDNYDYAMREGFVVAGKETADFLDESLSEIGLSKSEIRDFQLYWMPRMEGNSFNLVHFATDEYDRHVPLAVTPEPDTVIRVFMVLKALDESIDIAEQRLHRTERTGFTVVEWGGSELR